MNLLGTRKRHIKGISNGYLKRQGLEESEQDVWNEVLKCEHHQIWKLLDKRHSVTIRRNKYRRLYMETLNC